MLVIGFGHLDLLILSLLYHLDLLVTVLFEFKSLLLKINKASLFAMICVIVPEEPI